MGVGLGAAMGAGAATAGADAAAEFSLPPFPSTRLPTMADPASAGMATATQPESDVPASNSKGKSANLRLIIPPPSHEPF
jgi:hypothetical protein